MSEVLSLKRLALLMRSDLIGDYRSLAITCATLAAVMLISSMVTVAQGGETDALYFPWYLGGLYIWGAIGASFSFRELHDKAKNEAYLSLPASALEKTLARLLRATLGFFVFLIVYLTVTSALIEGMNWLVFRRTNGVFNAADARVWEQVPLFLVSVSIYFLGAAWFRKMHFVKTWLTSTAIGIALVCFAWLIVGIVFDQDLRNMSFSGGEFRNYYLAHEGIFDACFYALGVLFFVILPIFCWWVAYLRVKETEVSHGV